MAGAEVVADVRDVSVWFGKATVLDRVDLAVERGSVHGLLGPNGAGKTTLLAVLFGLVAPGEGSVRLFGRTRAEVGAHWLEGVGGFVEAPRFYPYLTGRRNLQVLAGYDGGVPVALVEDALRRVGLAAAAGQRVRGYSLGMRQRLGLAAALLRRPRLLILDEPTNGLDPAGVRDLRSELGALADQGVAVLLSSHDMLEVDGLCDAVTVLHRGRVAVAGPLEELRAAAPDPVWRLATSDDAAAAALAGGIAQRDPAGLRVVADRERLDDYMIGLGRAGIAVRALAQRTSALEALFFRVTSEPEPVATPAAAREVA